jgi:hypothetical protein
MFDATAGWSLNVATEEGGHNGSGGPTTRSTSHPPPTPRAAGLPAPCPPVATAAPAANAGGGGPSFARLELRAGEAYRAPSYRALISRGASLTLASRRRPWAEVAGAACPAGLGVGVPRTVRASLGTDGCRATQASLAVEVGGGGGGGTSASASESNVAGAPPPPSPHQHPAAWLKAGAWVPLGSATSLRPGWRLDVRTPSLPATGGARARAALCTGGAARGADKHAGWALELSSRLPSPWALLGVAAWAPSALRGLASPAGGGAEGEGRPPTPATPPRPPPLMVMPVLTARLMPGTARLELGSAPRSAAAVAVPEEDGPATPVRRRTARRPLQWSAFAEAYPPALLAAAGGLACGVRGGGGGGVASSQQHTPRATADTACSSSTAAAATTTLSTTLAGPIRFGLAFGGGTSLDGDGLAFVSAADVRDGHGGGGGGGPRLRGAVSLGRGRAAARVFVPF